MKALLTIFSLLFMNLLSVSLMGQNTVSETNISAARVIEMIIKNTGSATIPNTVDIFKEGDPQTPVNG
jgi:hypothetical protein